MLSVYERSNSDDRTIGELFYLFAAEVAEISFQQAISLIVSALVETVREFFHLSDEKIDEFMDMFITRLPDYLKTALLPGTKASIPA